ncbi:asparagine synthase (glutamine-hydrolyzing) [Rhodobacterales bacterium HKCCSP123]|nr:asparagine synthase (glutamine-hydrolyzing) [Rhodobacterales bacterium HKCCSP123]
MCGIAGILATTAADRVSEPILREMAAALRHRGPDAEGVWIPDGGRVGLGHRRLSILDLSEAGAQPMQSQDARFTLVFNGEIYNHLELRKDLDAGGAHGWRGHSDTETLLAAISRWGLRDTLRRARGMFALALWDAEEESLALARDRMGEKPLYLARRAGVFAFASELPALRPVLDNGTPPRLDMSAIAGQIATGVIPDSACVLDGVRKLRPGTILLLRPDGGDPVETVYEDFDSLMRRARARGVASPDAGPEAAASRIENVLRDVVSSQMISDVPLGSFLSGGIDSSLITALMQEISPGQVKTFSIGFDDMGYDESRHAEAVAGHLGTEHRTFRLREEDALSLIPDLARVYGEPFADSSQIPTLLLCREARAHVTVALTGDGGDEIFGGYNRHVLAPRIWSRMSRLPSVLKRAAPGAGRLMQRLAGPGGRVPGMAGRLGLSAAVVEKAARFGEVAAGSSSLRDVYLGLTRHCDDPSVYLQARAAPAPVGSWEALSDLQPEERMMALDSTGYLPGDILVKVDRAAMAASLETRAPFLDARTVEAAWSLALSHRIRDGLGKAILRDILFRHVPRGLIERPKQGFAVPIGAWLRGPLRDWAEDLLDRERLEAGGCLAADPVRELWSQHLSARADRGQLLWSILMLQQWLEEWALGPGG